MNELQSWNRWRLSITIAALIIFAMAAIGLGAKLNWWIGFGFLGAIATLFINSAIAEIEANPPFKGIPVLFGRLVNHLVRAGWYLLPFRHKKFLDLIPITGEEMEERWDVTMRTPDTNEIKIPFFIYFRVDDCNPAQFLIAGNTISVRKKIKDQIEEILREWITSPSKGPQTWETARQATEETLDTVLEALFHADLNRINHIPSDIPTEILFKYFKPGRGLSQEEDVEWGARLQALPDVEEVRDAVEKRQEIIQMARNGQLDQVNDDFRAVIYGMGIVVTRIGLSNIDATGETEKGANEIALARLNRKKAEINADITRIEGHQFAEEVREMTDIVKDGKEARRAISVRRGFTKENVEEKQVSISPDMTEAAKELGAALINAIFNRKGGN